MKFSIYNFFFTKSRIGVGLLVSVSFLFSVVALPCEKELLNKSIVPMVLRLPSGETREVRLTDDGFKHIIFGDPVDAMPEKGDKRPPLKLLRNGLHTVAGLRSLLASRPDVVPLEDFEAFSKNGTKQSWYHTFQGNNGIVFARLPDSLLSAHAQTGLEGAEIGGDSVYGWKTLFPEAMSPAQIVQSLAEILKNPGRVDPRKNGMIQVWGVIKHGKHRFEITIIIDKEGKIVTAYPLVSSDQKDRLKGVFHDLSSRWLERTRSEAAALRGEVKDSLYWLGSNWFRRTGEAGNSPDAHQMADVFKSLGGHIPLPHLLNLLKVFKIPGVLRQPDQFLSVVIEVVLNIPAKQQNPGPLMILDSFINLLESYDSVYGTEFAREYYPLFFRSLTFSRSMRNLTYWFSKFARRYLRFAVRSNNPKIIAEFFEALTEGATTDSYFFNIQENELGLFEDIFKILLDSESLTASFNRKIYRFACRMVAAFEEGNAIRFAGLYKNNIEIDVNRLSDSFFLENQWRTFYWHKIRSQQDLEGAVDDEIDYFKRDYLTTVSSMFVTLASYLEKQGASKSASSVSSLSTSLEERVMTQIKQYKDKFMQRNSGLLERRLQGQSQPFIEGSRLQKIKKDQFDDLVERYAFLKKYASDWVQLNCIYEFERAIFYDEQGRLSRYCLDHVFFMIYSMGFGDSRGIRGARFFLVSPTRAIPPLQVKHNITSWYRTY